MKLAPMSEVGDRIGLGDIELVVRELQRMVPLRASVLSTGAVKVGQRADIDECMSALGMLK